MKTNSSIHPGAIRRTLPVAVAIVAAAAASEARAAPTLQWSTYYGDSSAEFAHDVTFDSSSSLVTVGSTSSTNGIAGAASGNVAHDASFNGVWDGFVTKFDLAGNRLWGTYYGGSEYDDLTSTATGANDRVVAVGLTESSNVNNQVATVGDTTLGGTQDALIVVFNANGSRAWARYLGGSGIDGATGVCVGTDGAIYVVGVSSSTDLPTTAASHQANIAGIRDAFIAKLSSAGALQWVTYYGGPNHETVASDCAVDASHNVYVVGWTSASSGIAENGWDETFTGVYDAFLAKFDTFGARVEATYYGGFHSDSAHAVDLDPDGNIYVAGMTQSPDTDLDLMDTIGTSLQGAEDGFVVKFDADMDRVWGRYYGGAGEDRLHDLDYQDFAVLLSGHTNSSDNISTPDAFSPDLDGPVDGMFVGLDASDGAEFYATYLGGDGDEGGYGVAGTWAHAAVTGYTGSTGLATAGAHDTTYSGSSDVFLMLIQLFAM
ncbi:Beta-propeller repeat-containing protein [Nannocystis exedens]|uniref:Beta-propeller repeat-containing protein n=1 Tax=Nannocystis exedens TaxID=54 RepID=A0A1I2ETD6_9BACT|nr:SBBP repeat-containing protein [Nannocystis exedens]PCC73826.1 Beta-propeller repeat protein [Nannocystis exedens]SFE95728.1 Beta-propeller repeat-containing protein [Nannocystis exedens]